MWWRKPWIERPILMSPVLTCIDVSENVVLYSVLGSTQWPKWCIFRALTHLRGKFGSWPLVMSPTGKCNNGDHRSHHAVPPTWSFVLARGLKQVCNKVAIVTTGKTVVVMIEKNHDSIHYKCATKWLQHRFNIFKVNKYWDGLTCCMSQWSFVHFMNRISSYVFFWP